VQEEGNKRDRIGHEKPQVKTTYAVQAADYDGSAKPTAEPTYGAPPAARGEEKSNENWENAEDKGNERPTRNSAPEKQ
jgi:hypothetical protein